MVSGRLPNVGRQNFLHPKAVDLAKHKRRQKGRFGIIMKKSSLIGACVAMLGLAVASLFAQTQSTTTSTTTSYVQSSAVVGAKIKDSRGEDVGVIKDFVFDRSSGCLAYVVLSTGKGGAITSETRTVAAPWSVFTTSSEPRVFVTQVERERIYSAPVWESTRIEEYSRPDYINNVYGYFGVAVPTYFGASVGTSHSTTIGVSSSTGIQSSMGASSAPGGTATPRATAAATARASAAPSATGHPSTSPYGTPEKTTAPRMASPSGSRMPTSSRAPRQGGSPSTRTESSEEKESADERTGTSEKENTRSESRSEKSGENPGKPRESKKQQPSSERNPEAASTPR